MSKLLRSLFLLLLPIILVACATTDAPTDTPVQELDTSNTADVPTGMIVLADISDEPAKKIERFQPLADYLAANLSEFGIGVGMVQVAPDIDTMSQWFTDGKVDLYFDSLYPAMLVGENSSAVPILRRWKKGQDVYHSVFFALEESGITSLDDLKGQMIAFENETSTSGYMLPATFLIEKGYKLVAKPSLNAAVAADEIGYIFSDDDENTLQWVISGQVVAGVTDNDNFNDVLEESDVALVSLAVTEDVARNVTMIAGDMDPELGQAIIDLLLGLTESDEGLAILDKFKTEKFDEFPEGVDVAFERMKELFTFLQEQ